MSEWQSVKLKDICKLVSEKVSIKEATLTNYISTENMLSDFGGVRDAEKLPQTTFVNSFLPEDILFSNIRTYFKKVWIADFTGTVSPDVLVLRANINCDSTFLFYLMCEPSFTEYTVLTSRGAKMPRGDKEAILSYDLSLPPLPEQKAIADVLSALDDKIDLLQRQNETLEKMAETLFRQWFIEEAKEDWEEVTVGDIFVIKGGSTPSTKNNEFWDGEIYWTSPRDLSGNRDVYLHSTSRKITKKGLEKISSGLLPINTLLMSSRAPIGYLAIANIAVAINQGYIAIMEHELFTSEYMYLWCKTNMDVIKNSGNGSVFQEISKASFNKLAFVIPDLETLNKFKQVAIEIFRKQKNNEVQIQTLQNLRDTLLPKLMSGEVRVKLD